MLHDPDTSDLVPAADSGVQTEPDVPVPALTAEEEAILSAISQAAYSLEDLQAFLEKRDAWRQSRVATHEERCPF